MHLTSGSILRGAVCAGLGAAVLAGGPGPALASGFALREGSADWMANAFAGEDAKAYDAATVWANPAGMVRLDQSELDASVNGIFGDIRFSGSNSNPTGGQVVGSQGSNVLQAAATGGSYAVWPVGPNLRIGLGIDTPFGQRLSNPTDFVGRYQGLVASITDTAFAPALSWQITDRLSIGGGPVIDYFTARTTAAFNTGPTSAVTGDPVLDVHGDDVGAGFNVGLLYQVTPELRFGLDYRSRIRHTATGSQSIYVPPLLASGSPPTAAALAAADSPSHFAITLPDSVDIGGYWQVGPAVALLAELQWTDWSVLHDINVTPGNAGAPGSTLVENFRNSWSVAVGINDRVTRQLMLQAGIAYDESPVTDAARTSSIPDSDRVILGVGLHYDVTERLTLQAAYAHLFFAPAPINQSVSPSAGVLGGSYSSSAETGSIGLQYRF